MVFDFLNFGFIALELLAFDAKRNRLNPPNTTKKHERFKEFKCPRIKSGAESKQPTKKTEGIPTHNQ